MTTKKSSKERKIFLNCMNSWFSNFFIEEFRTDYIQDAKIKNTFMGTLDLSGRPLPTLFEPKITKVEIGYNYNQEIFQNDIFVYNLDDSNLSEVEFVIRGLQTIKYEHEKILILVSNIMTWAKTPIKTFTEEEQNKEGFDEEEVIEYEEEIKSEEKENKKEILNLNIENEEKKSETSKDNNEKNKKVENKDSKDKKDNNSKKSIDKIKIGAKDSKKDLNKKTEEIKEKENLSTINADENEEGEVNKTNNNIDDQILKKEKPKIKTFYYKESEFNKRIPNSKYFYYKILESLALTEINSYLKVYVICPGFIYGCGEDIFFDYFKESWKGNIEYMPIIGEGDNHIPTIHILDLIHTIKRVINTKPDVNYIFACDKTKNPTLKNILDHICKGVGGIETKIMKDFDVNKINIPHYTELSIDLRIKNSPIMEDEPRRRKEDIEDFEERKFKWHCEFGIPENIEKLSEEFNLYRDLKPIKIIISGPPYGGKSTIAKMISEKYKITHLTIDQICEWARNEKTELGNEVRQKDEEIEEIINKAMEEYEHRKNKKKTDPPFDPTPYRKYPDDFLAKIIKNKLNTGECISKGYILENYPKSYNDCLNLFRKENSAENESNIINKELFPDSVIIINNYTEESLKEKLKKKYPDYNERINELDNKFNRRLSKYKHLEQKNSENPKLLHEFYKENDIDVYFLNEQNLMIKKEEEEKKILEFLERNGPIDNEFKLYDEEEINIFENIPEENNAEVDNEEKKEEDKENIEEEKEIKLEEKQDNNNSKEIVNENIENGFKSNLNDKRTTVVEETKNIDRTQQKINELRERERILLDKKSEILRRYLSENVIPLISKGILNICQNLPDDPVESLAKFLSEIENNENKEKEEKNKAENEIIKTINESISF